jgi:hypothetical protein
MSGNKYLMIHFILVMFKAKWNLFFGNHFLLTLTGSSWLEVAGSQIVLISVAAV